MWWSWVLTTIGVTGLYLVTRRDWRGYVLGVGVQLLWIAYAIVTRQWGFVVSAMVYGFVNSIGLYGWRFAKQTTGLGREELARRWYERGDADKRPVNWIPWSEAPEWRKVEPYRLADWFLSQRSSDQPPPEPRRCSCGDLATDHSPDMWGGCTRCGCTDGMYTA